jgi:4-hydroxy-2-oxoheptanedioate aldolase
MRTNETKRRLAQGETVIGIGVGSGAPLVSENLSRAGFDFIMIDNQHGAWDDNGTMLAFRGISLGSATPMLRVQKNDYYTIGRALDRGALGVIVPMVNSAEEAREAARAVRYPPRGGRSIGPFGAAYLGDDYVEKIGEEVYLAVQIESQTAVDHAEEILSVDGIDGCWVGPGDLGLSMGVDLGTPKGKQAHEEAILKVVAACRKTGKVPGIAAVPQNAKHWIDRGFRFITVGSELYLLQAKTQEVLATLR